MADQKPVHHLSPAEKAKREQILREIKDKPGIRNQYAAATAQAIKSA